MTDETRTMSIPGTIAQVTITAGSERERARAAYMLNRVDRLYTLDGQEIDGVSREGAQLLAMLYTMQHDNPVWS